MEWYGKVRGKNKKIEGKSENPQTHALHRSLFLQSTPKGSIPSPLSQQINIIAKCYFFPFISINRDSLQIQKRNTRFTTSDIKIQLPSFFPLYYLVTSSRFSFFRSRYPIVIHISIFLHFQKYFSFYITLFFLLSFFSYTYIQCLFITFSL